MGNLSCNKKAKRKILLLFLGLDDTRQTVVAKSLAEEFLDANQASNIECNKNSIIKLNYQNYVVKIIKLSSGSNNIRNIWSNNKYFADIHGVICTVDPSLLDETKNVLQEILSHRKISGKPILLLIDEFDLIERLDLVTIANLNQCPTFVQNCSIGPEIKGINKFIKSDPDFQKGYHSLVNYIANNYAVLNKRVTDDREEQTHHNRESKTWSNPSNTAGIVLFERGTKSAIEIVRLHLALNDMTTFSRWRRLSFVARLSNRVAPLRLYGGKVMVSNGHDIMGF